jgi:hypothetical protein
LSEDETEWALHVKGSICGDYNMDNMSDYWYAQLALAAKGGTKAAFAKAKHWQDFRDEYKLNGTYEEGVYCIRRLLKLFPEVFLWLGFNDAHGCYSLAYDMAEIDLTSLTQRPGGFDAFLTGIYYIFQAMNMDLEAVRKGNILMVDCGGFDWSLNLNPKADQRIWAEVMIMYPQFYKFIKYLNSGSHIASMHALKKRSLSMAIRESIELGCRYEGRLRDFYCIPTVEAAKERLQCALEASLKRRYDNEKSFKLPPLPICDI